MEDMAYCGYFCGQCPVYKASACGDETEKERLARQYSTEKQPLTAEDIHCQGCGEDTQLPVFCRGCFIRACAGKKGLSHCGDCGEYPCGYWKAHIPADSPSRILLDRYPDRRQ